MPGLPSVKIQGPDSIKLSWTPPTMDGHSPITHYIVECRDMASERYAWTHTYTHTHTHTHTDSCNHLVTKSSEILF